LPQSGVVDGFELQVGKAGHCFVPNKNGGAILSGIHGRGRRWHGMIDFSFFTVWKRHACACATVTFPPA
jgi:hypothetical protein